ncbi:MAG TPA: membrane protein insertase YidC [Longimicrobiaceae bacterium]|nr:membrane protein insertase YidC [Longimicrobiaceae bacterium]
MEKRLGLAFAMTAVLMVLWYWMAPPAAPPAARAGTDSAVVAPAASLPAQAQAAAAEAPAAGVPRAAARTVRVRSPLYQYDFSTRGAALVSAELLRYPSYARRGENVQLVPRGATGVLAHRVQAAGQSLDLSAADFVPSADRLVLGGGGRAQELRFTYAPGGTPVAEVVYTFRPDDYLVDVRGRVFAAGGAGTLHTGLGTGLAAHDAREHSQERELTLVGWNLERIERIPLRKVAGVDTLPGPLAWAGFKDRYFFLALINQGGAQFSRVVARDVPDQRYLLGEDSLTSPRAEATAERPLGPDGAFAFQAYLGPLEHDRLAAVGHELEEVNPYGYRWLRPVIRPIAGVVLWALRSLHDNLGLAYGWVLVVFGVLVRLVTWPLNAKAMRAQMKNMAVQPQLQARMKEIQTRYAADPRRQQQEMVAMYKELGVSPFSMMSGCLPLLIPMPVLLTLFFVFQGAIEFRGARFAWLPDLSLQDPLYILPVMLMVSMFALQWVSTKLSGIEQNQQTKMMMWMMPAMMGIFFWFMPSGLNLYYASTNVASLPQQILIARERRRAMELQKAEEAAKARKPGAGRPGAAARRRKG